MKSEIDELIQMIQKEKFKIKITKKDKLITMKMSTLCDKLINLLKIVNNN